MSYNHLSPIYKAYVVTTSKIVVPYTFNQVVKDPNWFEAMQTKIKALESNDTWDLVPLPPNQHIIDCK